jgi:hypothetical protein
MTAGPAWGPPVLMTIADLRPGDFVEEIPTQNRITGARVRSAVATTEYDQSWTRSAGYRQRRRPVPAARLTFLSAGPVSYPSAFTVTARRRTS